MKRIACIVLLTATVLTLGVETSQGAIFGRFRGLFRSGPIVGNRVQIGTRSAGHTEATGTGTAVDGNQHPTPAPQTGGKTGKPGERAPGHTEATGKGTSVDGK